MKRILITGGNGYIGENLKTRLKEKKYDVVIIDKGMTVYDYGDYDGIVHLAALSGIIPCQNDFKTAVWDNIFTAFTVFEKSVEYEIPVVFTSSQAAKTPTANIYATVKAIIEMRAEQINFTGGDIRVLRLANVYGGYKYMEKKNTVIMRMLSQKFRGGPVHVHGDGKQERDFIHVDDVCEYLIRALEFEGKIMKPVDIGTGIATSIYDLSTMMRHHMAFTDVRNTGMDSSVADPSRAVQFFGYKAPNRIRSYIDEMIHLHSLRPVV